MLSKKTVRAVFSYKTLTQHVVFSEDVDLKEPRIPIGIVNSFDVLRESKEKGVYEYEAFNKMYIADGYFAEPVGLSRM